MECLRGILLRCLHAYSDPRHSPGRGRGRLDGRHDHGPARVPHVSQSHREPVCARLDEGFRGVPHERGAGQVCRVKGAIDLQILAAQAAQISGTHYIPVTASSAVSLGVDGVPIFAASTLGTLQSFPDGGPFTVSFDYLIRGVSTHVQEQSNGSIELDVGNRYYVPQK